MERRDSRAFRPADDEERRSGADRRSDDRRAEVLERRHQHDRRRRPPHAPAGGRRRTDWTALPPLSRLIPALAAVAVTLVDLGVTQAVGHSRGWTLFVVAWAFPIAAYALASPSRWRWHLASVWFAVGLYVMAAAFHITFLLSQ